MGIIIAQQPALRTAINCLSIIQTINSLLYRLLDTLDQHPISSLQVNQLQGLEAHNFNLQQHINQPPKQPCPLPGSLSPKPPKRTTRASTPPIASITAPVPL